MLRYRQELVVVVVVVVVVTKDVSLASLYFTETQPE
jgi:ribosome-binding factor A